MSDSSLLPDLADRSSVGLKGSHLCADCNQITLAPGGRCGVCQSSALLSLERTLNRPKLACRPWQAEDRGMTLEAEYQNWLAKVYPFPPQPGSDQYIQLRDAFYAGCTVAYSSNENFTAALQAFGRELRARTRVH